MAVPIGAWLRLASIRAAHLEEVFGQSGVSTLEGLVQQAPDEGAAQIAPPRRGHAVIPAMARASALQGARGASHPRTADRLLC